MNGLAYLFERFPSFTQTFCYREIAELRRQGAFPADLLHPPAGWTNQRRIGMRRRSAKSITCRRTRTGAGSRCGAARGKCCRPRRRAKSPPGAERPISFAFIRPPTLGRAGRLGCAPCACALRGNGGADGLLDRAVFWDWLQFHCARERHLCPEALRDFVGALVGAARAVVTVSDSECVFCARNSPTPQ